MAQPSTPQGFQPPTQHWIGFALLVSLGFIVEAAAVENWAVAVGYVTFVAAIGFIVMRLRRPRSPRGLFLRYGFFIFLLVFLVGREVVEARNDVADVIRTSCQERNQVVAQMTSEADRRIYCSCFAETLATPVKRASATAFLLGREPTPIRQAPRLTALATEASNRCYMGLPSG